MPKAANEFVWEQSTSVFRYCSNRRNYRDFAVDLAVAEASFQQLTLGARIVFEVGGF
jgi:hypothetical protein